MYTLRFIIMRLKRFGFCLFVFRANDYGSTFEFNWLTAQIATPLSPVVCWHWLHDKGLELSIKTVLRNVEKIAKKKKKIRPFASFVWFPVGSFSISANLCIIPFTSINVSAKKNNNNATHQHLSNFSYLTLSLFAVHIFFSTLYRIRTHIQE